MGFCSSKARESGVSPAPSGPQALVRLHQSEIVVSRQTKVSQSLVE